MVITYYGAACFKVQSGDTVLVFNPPAKNSEFKSPRFQSNLVLVSKNDKDFNGVESIGTKEEERVPFVIDSAGEYEVNGIYIKGVLDISRLNTIYNLNLEDINICHLGDFKGEKMSPEIKEEIGEVDILFIPAIDESNNGNDIGKIITQFEPKIVIPFYFKDSGLKKIIKEFGKDSVENIEKLTIKKKELAESKTKICVLAPVL